MIKKIIITGVFLLIISANIQPVFAEIFFPTTNFRLQGPPTFCVVIPSGNVPEQQKTQWTNLAQGAVLEWQEKLKEAEPANDILWDIEVKVVTLEESENCGINIYFEDKPSLTGTVVGYFTWPPGSITIYYLQLEICGLFTCYNDDSFISNDTIYAVALHEIGHSLGLDHYVSDDLDTNTKWQTSNKTPPSIMIPAIHIKPSLQEITNTDVNKVRQIYGSEGFYAFSSIPIPEPSETPEPEPEPEPTPTPEPIPEPTPIPEPIPEPTPIPIPVPPIVEPINPDRPFDAVSVSQGIIEVKDRVQQTIKISGKISDDKLLRGHPVIMTVFKPDQSIEILKTVVTSTGYFETFVLVDKTSIRGFYQVSVSYVGHVDKNMDVSFQVVDRITPPEPIPEPVFEQPSAKTPNAPTPNPNISSHVQTKPDIKIPQWLKNSAGWWADGMIDDETFIDGIEYLIENKVINVAESNNSQSIQKVPEWIKNNAKWWSQGHIDDESFSRGIEYLVKVGIIKVN